METTALLEGPASFWPVFKTEDIISRKVLEHTYEIGFWYTLVFQKEML